MVVLDRSSLPATPGRSLQSQGLRRHGSVNARRSRLAVNTRATIAPSRPDTETTPNATEFTQQIVEEEAKYIVQTYVRPEIIFTHAEGARMYDAHGKEYLDFAAGIAVNALGHGDSRWLRAVKEQAETISHASNLFHTVPQVKLAKKLVDNSFADKVFFANSGTEANEAAIKFARKWARVHAGVDPYDPEATAPSELISFTSSFHGRTMGSLALTYKQQYKTPFLPMIGGTHMVPWLDFDAVSEAVQKGRTAAVIVEPLQGEGGINEASREFLQHLRSACDEAGALLIFDEVQCGLGRTGKLWAHEHSGVTPDMMTLAKPLAGGLPIGALLARQHVADAMKPGDHGSTFAGNPLVCHAAQAVVDVIAEPAFLAAVTAKGERLRQGLRDALAGNRHVREVRGLGLICGIELDEPAGPVCITARDLGLIVITAGAGNIVRLVPPLTITEEDVDLAVEILSKAFAEVLP